MKRSNAAGRWICCLVIMAGVAIFCSSAFGAGRAAATAINVVDQNGRPVPNVPPLATSQIFDVTVGPNNMFVFSPSTVTISTGDTVRWTWAASGHSVTSGNPCIADGQFCSPNDMNCSLGTLSTMGTVYEHTFTQAGTYSYFCHAHCDYGMTGMINVTSAPVAQSAFSRKVHGAAGTFDVPLPLSGNVGIECRTGPTYQMIINFATSVTVQSASVTSGTGTVSSFSGSGTSQITVNLAGVTNVQRLTMTLQGVNDGTHMGDVPVSMGVLIGDTTANGTVNAGDVAQTKSQVGQSVGSGNFREDVNASGTISATDVAIVKSDVGTSLPPCASWTERAAYPTVAFGNAVASVGGNVYSFGGIANNTAIANAYEYSPATNTWTPIASLPAPRGWFSATSDGTYIYLLGGVDQNFSTTATLWRYDPGSNTYNTSLPPYTIPTYFHACAYLNGKVYRIAGRGIGTDYHVEVYNIATNSWSMAANYPVANHSLMAVAMGGYIYGAGGNAFADKTYRYDPNTDTWDDSAIADLPADRSAAASGVYNGRWVLAGGDVNFAISNSAIAWDPTTNTWSDLPNMVQARDYLAGATASQSFYAVAGASGPGTPTNDNQQYTEAQCGGVAAAAR